MSRKNLEREARQRLVLNAARSLFAKKGVENTSMEDIATAAEYTRRTLYSYFKSRDEISLLVMVDDMTDRWELQKKAIAEADNGVAKLIAWGLSLFEYSRLNRQSLRLNLYWDFVGIDRQRISPKTFKAFKSINQELAEGLRDIFQLGIADQSLRPELDIDLSISQFLCSFRSVLNRALFPSYSFTSFDPDDYVKHYLDLFKLAIQNPKGAAQ